MAGNDPRNPANGGPGDPRDPERTAAHRLGPPMRPMRPGAAPDSRDADTGFIDRVTDDGAPVDVAAVRRDDDLIEALAAGGAVSTADDTEFTLASLLADWRDEIVTTPVSAGPSVDELMAEVERRNAGGGDVTPIGEARSARRSRRFGMLAGSAAAAVAILGGGGVLVNSASPGDGALWNVKEVVFADAASQTLVTSEAKAQIQSADREASSGNQASAQTALVNARQNAAKVKNDKQRAALEEQIRQAEARAGLPVGSTDIPPQTSASATAPTVVPPPPTSSVSVPPTILQQTLTTTPPHTLPTTTATRPPVTTTPPTPTTTPPTTTAPTTEPTSTEPSTTTTTTEPASTRTTTTRPRPTTTTTTAAATSSPTFTVEPG